MDKKINNYIASETEIINSEYELICELVKLRKSLGYSQRDLCKIVGINQPSLARIESIKNSPNMSTFVKIVDALGYKIKLAKKSSEKL